jgi:hypothetical protein
MRDARRIVGTRAGGSVFALGSAGLRNIGMIDRATVGTISPSSRPERATS